MQKNRLRSEIGGVKPPQYPIESVDNALRTLLLLGTTSELRLTDVREHLGVAASTAHRLLSMLQWRGFLRQDPSTKVYVPGPALTSIAFSVMERLDVPRVAKPILDELSARLRETVHLGLLDGNSVRFVASAEPAQAVRVASRLGVAMPAHCTSTGKALLAQLPVEELERLYPREGLVGVTEHSMTSRRDLMTQLGKVRSDGFAVNREESEEGVGSVAVAVPTRGGSRFAVNLAAPIHRLPPATVKLVAVELTLAARRLADLIT